MRKRLIRVQSAKTGTESTELAVSAMRDINACIRSIKTLMDEIAAASVQQSEMIGLVRGGNGRHVGHEPVHRRGLLRRALGLENKKLAARIGMITTVITLAGMTLLWLVVSTNAASMVKEHITNQMTDAVESRAAIIDAYVLSAEEYMTAFALVLLS